MNKAVIGIVVAAIVGGGVYFGLNQLSDDSSDTNASTTQNESSNEASNESTSANEFNPLVVGEEESFVATVTGMSDGKPLKATLSSNGQGAIKFEADTDGQLVEAYITPEGFISCQEGQCYRIAGGEESLGLDEFQLTEEDYASFKANAKYLEDGSCPSGTCSIWEITDEGETGKVYIDKKTNRVSQVVSNDPTDGEIKIVYEYKDVSFTIPENVQELPGGI